MLSKSVIGQAEIARVLSAARQEAQARQWSVTIAVVDDGGHPLALLVAAQFGQQAARLGTAFPQLFQPGELAGLQTFQSGLLRGLPLALRLQRADLAAQVFEHRDVLLARGADIVQPGPYNAVAALIGATARSGSVGALTMRNLQRAGFTGGWLDQAAVQGAT